MYISCEGKMPMAAFHAWRAEGRTVLVGLWVSERVMEMALDTDWGQTSES